MSIVPVISSISHYSGSMAGGTHMTITGRGFSSTYFESLTVGGEECKNVTVDDSDGHTIWCTTTASSTEGWGTVEAIFNDVNAPAT